MKNIYIFLLLFIPLGIKAQEAAEKPNFYSVTFSDNKIYWAEDITPNLNISLPIKTLLFKHSQSVYVIDIDNGIIVESNGGYKKGSSVKNINLYEQGASAFFSPLGPPEFFQGNDIIIQFADGIRYIGKIVKAIRHSPYFDVTFYHSNSKYSFDGSLITQSSGKYKVGEYVRTANYCSSTLVFTSKRAKGRWTF